MYLRFAILLKGDSHFKSEKFILSLAVASFSRVDYFICGALYAPKPLFLCSGLVSSTIGRSVQQRVLPSGAPVFLHLDANGWSATDKMDYTAC